MKEEKARRREEMEKRVETEKVMDTVESLCRKFVVISGGEDTMGVLSLESISTP